MSEQAVQQSGPSAQLYDVDEVMEDSSSADEEGSGDYIGGDDRVPVAAPEMKREITENHVKLEKQFNLVLENLEQTEAMRFSAYISDPNSNGMYGFRFRLDTGRNDRLRTGDAQFVWESTRSISELHRLSEVLQKDKHIRGMGYSVPPLPEKKKRNSTMELSLGSDQRDMLVMFVQQMFTNFVFLGHSMVLNTFDVPSLVRMKIDTLARVYQTPLISSFLNKQGWNVKSWRKRWVVLYPDFTLRYYDSENEGTGGGTGFRGMVDIQAMYKINHKTSEKGESQRFSLSLKSDWQQTQRARVYKFETPDLEVRDTWIKAVSMLRDGKLSTYIPELSVVDALSVEELTGLSGVVRGSIVKSRRRRASQIQLEKEKESNIQMLTKLSEMREEHNNFEESQKKEQEEFEREQRKIEDEWSDLKGKIEAAKKTLQREQVGLKTLERELGEDQRKLEDKMEDAEKQVTKERLKFNLRSTNFALILTDTSFKGMKGRQKTVIENTAPPVYAGCLTMLTGESVKRKREVWYLQINSLPFLEWADLADGLNAPSATRMQISEVFPGKREHQGRAFVVRSSKKDKQITFITAKPSECQKWVRMIKNGLGILSDSDHEYIDEMEVKLEIDNVDGDYQQPNNYMIEVIEEKDNMIAEEEKEEVTLTTVSKEVSEVVKNNAVRELEEHGIVGETEV